jgi:mycoredoxin
MLGTSYAPFGYAPAAVAEVVVYGSRWCGVTMMVRRHLDRAGVPYRFVDWDAHP